VLFLFEGLDDKNRPIEGEFTALTEREALRKLQRRGYSVTKIYADTPWHRFVRNLSTNEASDKETGQFLKELISVIRIGLTPLETMDYIATNADGNKKFRQIALKSAQLMQDGELLSSALNEAGIKKVYCDVIAVGESTGNIVMALASIISQIELKLETKKGLMSIYIMPMVMVTFILLVTIVAIIYMIPIQRKVIGSLVKNPDEIPTLTSIAFWIGDYGIPIMVGLFVFILVVIFSVKYTRKAWHKFDVLIDNISLNIPVFGSFYRNAELSRVCSLLMLAMSSGGKKQSEVLNLIRNQASSVYFKDKLELSYSLVHRDGYLMSKALELVNFNGLIVNYVRRGETSSTERGAEMMGELSKEFSNKTIYTMELLKGVSEVINMFILTIAATPAMFVMLAPQIDQITLTVNMM